MANYNADSHVAAFFEGLLTTKTPNIFVTGFTKIPAIPPKKTDTAENRIQSSQTDIKNPKMANRADKIFVTLENTPETAPD